MNKYHGISYPKIFDNNFVRKIWKRLFCKRDWHLFDEVLSNKHYLHCDACELEIEIKKIHSQEIPVFDYVMFIQFALKEAGLKEYIDGILSNNKIYIYPIQVKNKSEELFRVVINENTGDCIAISNYFNDNLPVKYLVGTSATKFVDWLVDLMETINDPEK